MCTSGGLEVTVSHFEEEKGAKFQELWCPSLIQEQ